MGLSTAERNRRKRERKKREKEEQRKVEENQLEIQENTTNESDVVIEYVPEPLQIPDDVVGYEVLRAWQARSVAVVSDDERYSGKNIDQNKVLEHDDDDDIDGSSAGISKRKMREMIRPSIADLKRTVQRPDLVEAHDVTADDPEFLIQLKAVAGTVPVPRHWGRKRKYLQGKVSLMLF